MTPAQLERRSIIITIVASGSFGLIGVAISIASQSGAVFLDGVFSLIFAVVGLLTLYVSSLVQRPRDDQYPFGYATFEPMLNLFKGILITLALLYALWSAVTALMTGGQEVAAVGGIVYAAIAVGGGAALAVVLRKLAHRSGSPIVQVDAQNAVIDTLISGAVGVAFVATLLLQSSRWSQWARYADPVIMLAIAAIAAPQPIRIIRSNWRQVLGRAPERAIRERVATLVDEILVNVPHSETHLRVTEVGRYLYIHLYVIVPEDTAEPIDTRLHDRIRHRIYDAIVGEFPYLALDIGFTMDERWALSSSPAGDPNTIHAAAGGTASDRP
jgi:cation diffusion facilitator family transporter